MQWGECCCLDRKQLERSFEFAFFCFVIFQASNPQRPQWSVAMFTYTENTYTEFTYTLRTRTTLRIPSHNLRTLKIRQLNLRTSKIRSLNLCTLSRTLHVHLIYTLCTPYVHLYVYVHTIYIHIKYVHIIYVHKKHIHCENC